jgi:hypothetical protein
MADYPFHYDPPKLRISDSEIVVQKQCRRSVAILLPDTRLVAIPNGQKRTRWQQQQAKAEGLSKGFPDLIAICRNGRVAFPEIKALAPLTAEQREWLDWLHIGGHNCGVFRSDATLIEALRSWGFV